MQKIAQESGRDARQESGQNIRQESGQNSRQAGEQHNRLAAYLKDRRMRIDSAALGYPQHRRRTPGLRREEVAQRASISATWYTWLEQGRGGGPSAEVLARIAEALMLTDAEREHLFLIGLGHPPEALYRETRGISPRLQRVLDALEPSVALIRTATWDVVAWNRAATVVLKDYAAYPPSERNILRAIFLDPQVRAVQENWESVARFVVAAFRADAVRAGADAAIKPLVDELCHASRSFAEMWRDQDIQGQGDGIKRLNHPQLGNIAMEFSTFAVDGRLDLGMIVYNPVSRSDADRIRELMTAKTTLR